MKKLLMFLFALNLLATSTMLFITASGQGALYEVIKPSVVTENYKLINHYVGDAIINGDIYEGILIFNVQPLDDNLIKVGAPTQLYFKDEYTTIPFGIQDGDIIICLTLVQITGEKEIISIVDYDTYTDAKLIF
ncbi:MAG: hypothetical protein P1P69_04130 [Methanosarcinaceae archaeon]|nr:hypothetical protein [Methanosarcinaceae archaeon]